MPILTSFKTPQRVECVLLKIQIHPNENGAPGYWAKCINLPGCYTSGDTISEIEREIHEAIELCLEDYPDVKDYAVEFEVCSE